MKPAPKITPKFVVAVVEQAREIATEEASLRMPSPLGIAVVLAGVILIGWGVMRSTLAQGVPTPTAPATTQDPAPKPTPAPKPEPIPARESDKPAETVAPRAGDVPEATVPKLPDSPDNLPLPESPKATHNQLSELPPADPAPPVGENDDPEKMVQAFVEQNRKVAEGQLKGLKEEEARLRARLQKVEGGIKRWEALLAALEKGSSAASPKGLTLTEPHVPGSIGKRSLESAPTPPTGNSVELPRDFSSVPGSTLPPPAPR